MIKYLHFTKLHSLSFCYYFVKVILKKSVSLHLKLMHYIILPDFSLKIVCTVMYHIEKKRKEVYSFTFNSNANIFSISSLILIYIKLMSNFSITIFTWLFNFFPKIKSAVQKKKDAWMQPFSQENKFSDHFNNVTKSLEQTRYKRTGRAILSAVV